LNKDAFQKSARSNKPSNLKIFVPVKFNTRAFPKKTISNLGIGKGPFKVDCSEENIQNVVKVKKVTFVEENNPKQKTQEVIEKEETVLEEYMNKIKGLFGFSKDKQ
jgi:hypothetical protein